MNKGSELTVTSSPHFRDDDSVAKIMYSVILALVPSLIVAIVHFGLPAFLLILACSITALVAEGIAQKVRGVEITITDGSALVTGLLLAMSLPPRLPLWVAILGTLVAIILGKQLFGGLGCNYFNPALIGRAFILASFPVAMTDWYEPFSFAATSATPLEGAEATYTSLFLGNVSGSLGEVSALAVLLGGLYLLYKGYIDWRIPVGYLGTALVLTTILGGDPLFRLLAGSLLIGAFFYATDMVTTPITKKGRWIFAIGAGVLVVVIRQYGNYPEGVLFSILLMNMFVPIIDKYTTPTIFGEVSE